MIIACEWVVSFRFGAESFRLRTFLSLFSAAYLVVDFDISIPKFLFILGCSVVRFVMTDHYRKSISACSVIDSFTRAIYNRTCILNNAICMYMLLNKK